MKKALQRPRYPEIVQAMSLPLIALLPRPSSLCRASLVAASLLSLASCKNTTGAAGGDSLYASNHGSSDGGYRPYNAAKGGVVQSTSPQYSQPIPPPPPGYEMPSAGEFRSPPASTPSSSVPAKKSTVSANKSSGTSKPSGSTSSVKKKAPTLAKKKTSSSGSASAYTVVKGDTLYGLALRKHTTVAKIKAASGIATDKLSIGQKLRIP